MRNENTPVKFKERNTRTLHNHMWDMMEKLENGEVTAQHARAASSLVSNMIATARLEMEYARFVSDVRSPAGADGRGGLPALEIGG